MALPTILNGDDVFIIKGSGRTFLSAIAMASKIHEQKEYPQILYVAASREAAIIAVVTFKILRKFSIELIKMMVFDDADVVCTTSLIQEHIIKRPA